MTKIDITDRLSGSLSETYFKEYCDQQGWAYVSLEQINENKIKDNVIKFKKGFHRFFIQLPDDYYDEPRRVEKREYY